MHIPADERRQIGRAKETNLIILTGKTFDNTYFMITHFTHEISLQKFWFYEAPFKSVSRITT